MNRDIDKLLSALRPELGDLVAETFPPARRAEILARATRGTHDPPRRVPVARGPSRRAVLLLVPVLLAVAATVVLAGSILGGSGAQQAAGAVVFRKTRDGDVIAIVRDPFVAQRQLNLAFASRGYHIEVTLMPVSPSLVGRIVYTEEEHTGAGPRPLVRGLCASGGGGDCTTLGVDIGQSFKGQATITLGRPARPGETYASAASAFAIGERLHCSGLLGGSARTAQIWLREHGIVPSWRETVTAGASSRSVSPRSAPSGSYVWEAVMTAPGRIAVFVQPRPWPDDPRHGSLNDRGCR